MSHPSVGNDQLPLGWSASKMDRDQGWDHNLSKPYQTWTIGRQKEVRTLFDVTFVRALPTRYAKTSSAPSSPTALEERKTFSVKSLEFLGQWGQHRGCTETSEMYHVDHSTVIICHQYDMWYHAYIYISIYLSIYLFIHFRPQAQPYHIFMPTYSLPLPYEVFSGDAAVGFWIQPAKASFERSFLVKNMTGHVRAKTRWRKGRFGKIKQAPKLQQFVLYILSLHHLASQAMLLALFNSAAESRIPGPMVAASHSW